MSISYESYLCHYGIKGMKWGVRRFDTRKDQILPKGTVVKRVSLYTNDYVNDDKKYVSTNQEDHDRWQDYLGNAYLDAYGRATYQFSYKTVKDVKVMSSTKQGELYTKMLLDEKFSKQAKNDTKYATESLGVESSNDPAENISRNIAKQTTTGKAFLKEVSKQYDAIVDTHGTNVADNPVIVLNASTTLRQLGRATYTEPVQDFINRYGLSA